MWITATYFSPTELKICLLRPAIGTLSQQMYTNVHTLSFRGANYNTCYVANPKNCNWLILGHDGL